MILPISLSGKLSRGERPQMNPAELRWTSVNFPCLAMCSDYLQTPRGPVSLHPACFSARNPPHRQLYFGSRGHCPLLNFFSSHPLPHAPPRAAITLSVSGAVCLQAPESLICLGSQLWHAWEGQGKEMGGSSHLTTNLSSPPFLFLPIPSLPHPNQRKDHAAPLRKNCSESLVWNFFFPSLSNEIRCESLPFPCTHNRMGLLLQKAECVCVRACNVCLLAHMCLCVGV